VKVAGTLTTGPEAPAFAGATARIEILDVTLADAAAEPVAERMFGELEHKGGAGPLLEFAIETDDPPLNRRHIVRAHVDLTGTGTVSAGDLITVESYPITAGEMAPLRLHLRVVEG
jgi:hypothetical protein